MEERTNINMWFLYYRDILCFLYKDNPVCVIVIFILVNICMYTYMLGLCDNGKSNISMHAIIIVQIILTSNIILIMLSTKYLVLGVSSCYLN